MIADDVQKCFFEARAPAHDVTDAAHGLEFALIDDGHAVANGLHFAQLVRLKEHCPALIFQALDDFTDFHAAQRVEAAGRFVENQ